MNLKISVQGLDLNSKSAASSKKTVLTSTNLMDENSFAQPNKVPKSPFVSYIHIANHHYTQLTSSVKYVICEV